MHMHHSPLFPHPPHSLTPLTPSLSSLPSLPHSLTRLTPSLSSQAHHHSGQPYTCLSSQMHTHCSRHATVRARVCVCVRACVCVCVCVLLTVVWRWSLQTLDLLPQTVSGWSVTDKGDGRRTRSTPNRRGPRRRRGNTSCLQRRKLPSVSGCSVWGWGSSMKWLQVLEPCETCVR